MVLFQNEQEEDKVQVQESEESGMVMQQQNVLSSPKRLLLKKPDQQLQDRGYSEEDGEKTDAPIWVEECHNSDEDHNSEDRGGNASLSSTSSYHEEQKTHRFIPPSVSPANSTSQQVRSGSYGNGRASSSNGCDPLPSASSSAAGWETVWERFAAATANDPGRLQLLKQWVSLPTIAVLGDTSCGKSSLLSQLSGIMELPTSHEITTKCPMEIQMRYSTHVQAKINIAWNQPQHAFDNDRKPLWEERIIRTVQEWNEIPRILMQAQQVILHHHQRSQGNGTTNETERYPSTTVAPDVISILLNGPMYPQQQTLTLVDLPGLVQRHNAMTESPTVSSEINQLLLPYLQNEHCLLVVVLPANVDYHNAHALKLASQYDPQGQRTCAVWTKPDLIDKGAESAVATWLEKAPQVLGIRHFHMVKCRGQAAVAGRTRVHHHNNNNNNYNNNNNNNNKDGLKMSLASALENEEQFFARNLPWKEMDPTLFGSTNLRKKLSYLQARLVQDSLPTIFRDLQGQWVQAQAQLQAMGGRPLESAAERRHYYQTICHRLLQHLQTSLSGKGGGNKTFMGGNGTNFHSGAVQSAPPPPSMIAVAPQPGGTGSTTTNHTPLPLTLAANRLHEACEVFTSQIKQGSLATIRSIVEGAHVLVTSARGTVRGEVVHMDEDEGYCCVDLYNNPEKQPAGPTVAMAHDILFEFTGQRFDVEMTIMEENDVWSDGTSVYIARGGGVYDALRKIPLDCVWTDPTTWLQSHMAQFRTDDLSCFLNVESFARIVQEFMQEDWKPACQQLLERMKTILQQALTQALEQALTTACATPPSSSIWNDDTAPPRYPGLRQLLQRHLREVADSLVQEASLQVESHLAMEAHPFTQDDALFVRMNRARYSRLKRELEVALLAEIEGQSPQHLVHNVSNNNNTIRGGNKGSAIGGVMMRTKPPVSTETRVDAVQSILDSVFERHEKMSVREHLAFEMEIVLESYGEIATRRVLDRTPMICWQVFRSYVSVLSSRLMSVVTDQDLTTAMTERAEFAQEYQAVALKCEKLQEIIQLLESLL